jgi:hypothetical protein
MGVFSDNERVVYHGPNGQIVVGSDGLISESGFPVILSSSAGVTGAAASSRDIQFQTSGVPRWILRADSTVESGGDAGTAMVLIARHDDGTNIGNVFTISRITGGAIQWNRPFTFSSDNTLDVGQTGGVRVRRIYLGTAVQIEADGAAGLTSGLCLTNQTNGAAGNAGTLNNAPAVGNPTFWLPVNINGALKKIPCW